VPGSYRLEERTPTPEEYRRICRAVGWEAVLNFDAAPAALERSIHAVVALAGETAVGMGRIVGDGSIYFYVQDVAVVPAHQGGGLGARIVGALVDWVSANAPAQSFLGVFAAAGTEPFYRRFGFEAHAGLTGMFQTTPPASTPPGARGR
jgi:GNAT superfamily N-acetyltransferase